MIVYIVNKRTYSYKDCKTINFWKYEMKKHLIKERLFTVEGIKGSLRGRPIHLVAKETGLSHTTLYKIMNNHKKKYNPNLSTIEIITSYLHEHG